MEVFLYSERVLVCSFMLCILFYFLVIFTRYPSLGLDCPFVTSLCIYIFLLLIQHAFFSRGLQDVAAKIMAFSQQGPRTVCILSANGAICNVTLRQPATSGGTVSYEVCSWLVKNWIWLYYYVQASYLFVYFCNPLLLHRSPDHWKGSEPRRS